MSEVECEDVDDADDVEDRIFRSRHIIFRIFRARHIFVSFERAISFESENGGKTDLSSHHSTNTNTN